MRFKEFVSDVCPVCGQTPCNCTGIKEEKVRLDPACWHNKKIGNPKTKMKGGVRVNNCVPKEGVAEDLSRRGFLKGLGAAAVAGAAGNAIASNSEKKFEDFITDPADKEKYIQQKKKAERLWAMSTTNSTFRAAAIEGRAKLNSLKKELATKYKIDNSVNEQSVAEDWQKTNKQDKTDGMSPKAVKAYRRENPGSKLQTAVTTKPSKLKPGSKAAKRRKSFCARMSGVEGPMKDEKGRPTAKAKALKRWNC